MPGLEGGLWLFAGCNGAGKSSLISVATAPGGVLERVPLLNPDLLTKELLNQAGYHDYADVPADVYRRCFVQAATEMEEIAHAKLRARETICIETVLSTRKYLGLVDAAVRAQVPFKFIYIVLSSPQLACERVARRVRSGGHPVPEAKIVERYVRSLNHLPIFAERASYYCVYDNSSSEPAVGPQAIAVGWKGVNLILSPECPAFVRDRLPRSSWL